MIAKTLKIAILVSIFFIPSFAFALINNAYLDDNCVLHVNFKNDLNSGDRLGWGTPDTFNWSTKSAQWAIQSGMSLNEISNKTIDIDDNYEISPPVGDIYLKEFYQPDYSVFSDYGKVGERQSENVCVSDFSLISETRFISLSPSGDISSSSITSFSASLNILSTDFIDGSYVRFKYVRQEDLQAVVASPDLLWHTLSDEEVFASGYNFVATSSEALGLDGTYLLKVELRRPSHWYTSVFNYINIFSSLDPDVVISSTTRFVYGTTTAFEKTMAQWGRDQGEFMASSTAAQNVKKYCDLSTSFSFGLCVSALFLPSPADISSTTDKLKDGFFSYVPFGYITRVKDILATTSTSSLPTISYTFPVSAPAFLSGANFHFDPWDYFYVDGSPLKDEIVANDGSGDNIWDIFEPITKIIVYMTLFWMIVRDLLKINYSPHPKDNL